MTAGDRVELAIERLAAGGDGIAHHRGRVVFVPYSAPGDVLTCRVSEVKPRYARAQIERVERPGPERRTARCPYFGRCGGCTWMHLEEAAQTAARGEILRDALVRIGGFRELPELEWIPSPRAFGYRARARVAHHSGRIGFRTAGSHQIVDVDQCAVLDPETQRELDRVRNTPPSGNGEIELRGFGSYAAGLRVSPGSFFQANRALWDSWSQAVADACGQGRLLVELYAGVGFYTRRIETSFERVIAVERGPAVRDLDHNCGAEVRRESAEKFAITELMTLEPDVVLLNPPRSGCDAVVIDSLTKVRPRQIVYVSCDPATLARDLSRVRDSFRLRRIVGIDALPQTHALEAIVCLQLRPTSP